MGKAPAFQFYVKDWLSDPELQCVSASTRGMWIDALCYMWQARERGKLTGTVEELSKLLRATNGDFTKFMEDVKRHRFADVTMRDADVTNRDNEVTLINRRMLREENDKENHALRQKAYRERQKSDKKVTPVSPTASPSPTPYPINKRNIEPYGSVLSDPDEFASLYNKFCPNLIRSSRISQERRSKIKSRLKECNGRDWWIEVFKKANEVFIPPHEGHPKGWKPDLWFIIKNDDNAIKIYEGKYGQQGVIHKQHGAESLLKKVLEEEADEKARQKNLHNRDSETGGSNGRANNRTKD